MIHRKKAAPAPPMGWNSWDCYGAGVTEEILLKNARFIREHLLPYGWQYVVCDIQWYEPTAKDTRYHDFAPLCMDSLSRLIPAENRFPSSQGGKGFSVIAQQIHEMGLKFGIHIMRGIPRQAVHAGTPIAGAANRTARDIAAPFSLCSWNTDMYGVDANKEGAGDYYDSLFQLYASWGVDFVKVDDICDTKYNPGNPYSAEKEIELIRAAVDRCGRDMVLSLSPGPARIEKAWHLSANADMWRLTDDFWDDWAKLKDMFRRCEIWYTHVGNGCWPDCDMLPLGRLCVSDRGRGERPCRFTRDEQKTMMNLWCMFRSPLILGCETENMDSFTLSLLTNREVLALNQRAARSYPLRSGEKEAVWESESPEDNITVGLFNLSDEPRRISVSAAELGREQMPPLHDLWTGESVAATGSCDVLLRPHESCLLGESAENGGVRRS